MLARLWWKETRLFWHIWVFLVLVGGAGQWLTLHYFHQEARHGALFALAISLACLYGIAASAAAFAGERENGTLLLLDTMAIDRWLLWGSKFSFALVSTLALAVVLIGLGALRMDSPDASLPRAEIGLVGGVLLLEVIGWGLLWSALLSSALGAAVLAVLSVGLITPLTMLEADRNSLWPVSGALLRLAVAAALTIASALIMTWSQQRRGSPLRTEAVTLHESAPPARREWAPAARRLAWQALRQERGPVLVFATIGLVLGLMIVRETAPILVGFAGLAGLWIGANVFGAENRGRTQRFLTNHGASPALVWTVKVAVGALGLLLIVALQAVAMEFRHSLPFGGKGVLVCAMIPLNCFAVAQLCGMTIRRGITAGVLSLIASAALIAPQAFLLGKEILPGWALLATPAALLAVTWAWSADWMFDRPGFGRWARLGLLMTAAFAGLLSTFAVYRDASVPVATSVGGLEARPQRATPVPPEQNAAPLYVEARKRWQSVTASKVDAADPPSLVNQVIAAGWNDSAAALIPWLRDNAGSLDLARRAAMMPQCQFHRRDRMTAFSIPEALDLQSIAQVLAVDGRERIARGDLAGAWTDIETIIRMARHLAQSAPIRQRIRADEIEHEAMRLAMAWLGGPGQTPERLHAALDSYRRLPPAPRLSETIEFEWRWIERTLDLSVSDIRSAVRERIGRLFDTATGFEFLLEFATTPWEIARARRVFPILFTARLAESTLEPWRRSRYAIPRVGEWAEITLRQGSSTSVLPAQDVQALHARTPLAKWLMPALNEVQTGADRAEVERRALPQLLALRSWQLRHGGRYPGQLADLVPDELDRLPTDPYARGDGRFRYLRSQGPILLRFGDNFDPSHSTISELQRRLTSTRQQLLYSVGINGRDDMGNPSIDGSGHPMDIVFPLRPEEPSPAGAKPDPRDDDAPPG